MKHLKVACTQVIELNFEKECMTNGIGIWDCNMCVLRAYHEDLFII